MCISANISAKSENSQVVPKKHSAIQFSNVRFKNLSVKDGLSQVSVNSITQDSLGFLWFATQQGLDRYDGKEFTSFVHDAEVSESLAGDYVTFVKRLNGGVLWIGTNGQGVSIKGKNDSHFERIAFYEGNKEIKTVRSKSIFQDSSSDVWVGTAGQGLFKFDKHTRTFQLFWKNKKKSTAIWSVVEWQRKLYFATENLGIWELDYKDSQIRSWNAELFKEKKIQHLLVEENMMWIATNQGLWTSEILSSPKPRAISFMDGLFEKLNIYKLFRDSLGNLWIGTLGDGIFIHTKDNQWLNLKTDDNNHSLSNNRVLSFFQDSSGVIWVGTEGGGLNYFDPYSTIFNHWEQNKTSTRYLNDKMIYAIYKEQNGDWWIGTESGGLNHLDAETGLFRYYNVENGILNHNTVRAILPWDDSLWIATLGGISRISKQGVLLNHFDKSNLLDLGHDAVFTLHRHNENQFWIGSYGGLDLFDSRTNTVIRSVRNSSKLNPLPRNVVTSLLQTDDSLWVGTWGGGLVRYSLNDTSSDYYTYQPNLSSGISHNSIWSIFQDDQGTLWIGTDGGGLNQYNPTNQTFVKFGKKEGLANSVIYGILQGEDGNLWLSSNRGLSRLSTRNNKITNFFVEDGLQGSEFNAGAYYSDNQVLAFGGINGITWFTRQAPRSNPFAPETRVVDFLLFNQSYKKPSSGLVVSRNDLGETSIALDYRQTMLSIEFRALHFSVPSQNKFSYRLLGISDQWIDSKPGQYSETFTGLGAGNYIFEVFAISKDGVADTTPERIHINVSPPPWRTWWSYLGYLAVIAIALFYYRKSHLNRLSTELTLNRRLVEIDGLKESLSQAERMVMVGELASNITHSLRNPLANIRSTAELIEADPEAGKVAREDCARIISEVDRLSLWIRELLAYSKVQGEEEIVNLEKLLKGIVVDFSDSLSKKTVDFHFNCNAQLVKVSGDANHLGHMFTSILTNAVDSIDESGTVIINLTDDDTGSIKVTIKDNGCGMSKDIQQSIFDHNVSFKPNGLGIGLSLVKRICERHNAKISVSSKLGKGTQFEIIFNLAISED